MPSCAILDPELTRSMHPHHRPRPASTRSRIASKPTSRKGHPMADGIALAGLRLIAENSPRVVAHRKISKRAEPS